MRVRFGRVINPLCEKTRSTEAADAGTLSKHTFHHLVQGQNDGHDAADCYCLVTLGDFSGFSEWLDYG